MKFLYENHSQISYKCQMKSVSSTMSILYVLIHVE